LKLLDKIWSMLGLVEADEADEPQQSTEKAMARSERKTERVRADDNKSRRIAAPEPIPTPLSESSFSANIVPATAGDAGSNSGKVVITQPMGFDDARQIAENLTNGKTVFVNFERADGDTIKRTVDFMSGITYAVGGTVQRISSAIFLFAPARVEVFVNERYAEDEQSALPWRRS
jgi:cell division inhibitor SepF